MIDRSGRERLVAALVDFMNDRIRADRFDEIRRECADSSDSSLAVVAKDLWSIYSDLGDEPFSGNAEMCEMLARLLAFLKSDDELVEEVIHLHARAPYAVLLAAVVFGIGGVLLFDMSVLFVLVIWIAHAPFAILLNALDERHLRRSQDRFEFAPFRDRGQWEARRELIRDIQLPVSVQGPREFKCPPIDAALHAFFLTLWMPVVLAVGMSKRFVTVWLIR